MRMDDNQILKRIEWLDDERRKDKTTLSLIDDRTNELVERTQPLPKKLNDFEGELTRIKTILGRIDQFDETILQLRVEVKESLDALEKEIIKREEEGAKVRRIELRAIDKSVADIRKGLTPLQELQRGLQARIEEEKRMNRSLDDLVVQIDAVKRGEEEYLRSYRLLEDGRRQDSKRLLDLQGEVATLRKHMDDQRGRMELSTTGFKKLETRLNELVSVETERRESQAKFLEEQSLVQVERERAWKAWEAKLDTIVEQTADVEMNLQTLDTTHRDIQRSQQALEELTQKVDRRINEMTEIQRLAEERFRQEWVTFKADDQKRWTNYTLTQDEDRGEVTRQTQKIADRVTDLEDDHQIVQDTLRQIIEQTDQRVQSLLVVIHDWVSKHDRSLGRER
jgi:chromosome segregation ATPase